MKPLESKVFPDFDTEFVQLKNCLPDYKVKKNYLETELSFHKMVFQHT
jgi:hypothetical protein